MDLRQWLIQKQQELRDSDYKFAPKLNITAAQWGYIRRGKQRVSRRVARAARRSFPEFGDLIDYLAMQAPDDIDQTDQMGQGDAA